MARNVSRSSGRTYRSAVPASGSGGASQAGARSSRSMASSAPSASSAFASASEKNSTNCRRAASREPPSSSDRPSRVGRK